MDKYFRLEGGERVNIVEHTLEQVTKWPHLKVTIGTDSQDHGKKTRYVTAVVFRYGHRGAHYAYHREEVAKERTMYERLFNEAVRTIETAQMIDSEIPIAFEGLEFDYNEIPDFNSHKLLSQIKGWAMGLQYKPIFKSDQLMAVRAADHICKRRTKKGRRRSKRV